MRRHARHPLQITAHRVLTYVDDVFGSDLQKLRLLVIGPSVGFEPRTFERLSFSSLAFWAMLVCSESSAFGSGLMKRIFLIKVLSPDLSI